MTGAKLLIYLVTMSEGTFLNPNGIPRTVVPQIHACENYEGVYVPIASTQRAIEVPTETDSPEHPTFYPPYHISDRKI